MAIREMGDRKPKTLVLVLVGVIIVLALLVAYAFFLRPTLSGYSVKLQNEGFVYALNSVVSQVQQRGYVEIPLGNNQTLILVPYVSSDNSVSSSG